MYQSTLFDGQQTRPLASRKVPQTMGLVTPTRWEPGFAADWAKTQTFP